MVSGDVVLTAALMAGATAASRFLPFLLGGIGNPRLRRLFAELFPPAILAVLLVYFAWGSGTASGPARAGQALGAVVTVLAHLRFRNLLLSVGAGTAACMLVANLLPR